jgi:hypothetical protein
VAKAEYRHCQGAHKSSPVASQRWQYERRGARCGSRLAGASWLVSPFHRCWCSTASAKLHNAALHSVSASQSQAPFVAATASRPTGESNRRYAKLPTLKRARQPPALPSRFASYVQSPVALVVCWRCGISQALRAWFWLAASPVMLCWPPPTPGACLLRSIARAVCPSAPQGGSLRTAPGAGPAACRRCAPAFSILAVRNIYRCG